MILALLLSFEKPSIENNGPGLMIMFAWRITRWQDSQLVTRMGDGRTIMAVLQSRIVYNLPVGIISWNFKANGIICRFNNALLWSIRISERKERNGDFRTSKTIGITALN